MTQSGVVGSRVAPLDAARVSPETDALESVALGTHAAEQARLLSASLHLPGVRDAHRVHLLEAKSAFEAALAHAAESPGPSPQPPAWATECRLALLGIYLEHAKDASHGAGQLSRGAQRAPTEADCEDGWDRVSEITRGAEDSAAKARELAASMGSVSARDLASSTEHAARSARAVIENRNHAYTFHTNPSFSFGEGWYAAAAGVLGGVRLQVEPGQRHTLAGERFLRDCGLSAQLQAYQSRPRANKALPLVVADAFRRDPVAAQSRLRSAFLAGAENVQEVHSWLARRLPPLRSRGSVLVWVRRVTHDAHRNSPPEELAALCDRTLAAGLTPIAIGDSLGTTPLPTGALDLTWFWKEPLFQGLYMRRAQLELFERLRADWGLVGQLGVTTAGMDGPALLGLPTLYITARPNVRLGLWVGAVPGYQELVRDFDRDTRVSRTLSQWLASC